MNSIHLVLFSSFFLLLSLPSAFANESDELCTENCPNFNGTENSSDIERPKFYKIIDPDIHIDFSNDNHWQGLSSTSDFWKIKNNEGYFILNPQIKQLNSATFDLNPLLESEVGDDWILRYRLKIDHYQQGTTSKWSELLVGLFSESVNGLTPQWGLGTAFLNGDNTQYTNLMYGFGTYNEWHCCPMKGELENQNSLPGTNKIWWVEYVKEKNTFTVRLFSDSDFKNLIEQKSVTGWETESLRYLKIFPLVEDNSVNGYMHGRIDDIKFYNHETTVYQPDKKPIPESLKPKTLDEILEGVYGQDYNEPSEPEQVYTSNIPEWLKETVSLWANDEINNNEFYSIVKDLVINDRMLIEELNAAYDTKLDITHKPQTIKIPKDENCATCEVEKFIVLNWEIPENLPRNASAVLEIITPDKKSIKLTTTSKEETTLRITNDFAPGLYIMHVTYGNVKFEISPMLLTNEDPPKIPFWIKYNSDKWANGGLDENEFVDSLIFLIQNGEIIIDYKIFVKNEPEIILTPQEKLEKFFPSSEELAELSPEIPPPLWEYVVTSDALRLINMDYVSIQKILEDRSRTFDPLQKYDVPFTMMQIYQFDSNSTAKEFIEEQIWTNNVIIKGTISDDDLSYSDYKYERIFETADMSGTSETTGDCLYRTIANEGGTPMDESHFVQCIIDENVIQIYLYEDYHNVDETFGFNLMDIILKKINENSRTESVKNILTLDNIRTSPQSSSPQSSSPQSSSPQSNDVTDPEISGTTVGIHDFICKKDDFGTITMNGKFVNGVNSFEQIKVNISIESYDGIVLASGSDYVLKVNPYETRTIDGYVFVDKPFHKCTADIDWNLSH